MIITANDNMFLTTEHYSYAKPFGRSARFKLLFLADFAFGYCENKPLRRMFRAYNPAKWSQ